jgi:hypothetical protein
VTPHSLEAWKVKNTSFTTSRTQWETATVTTSNTQATIEQQQVKLNSQHNVVAIQQGINKRKHNSASTRTTQIAPHKHNNTTTGFKEKC